MAPTTQMSALLLSLAFGAATALPAVETVKTYPEVIPGPGLPSLASLNLTSVDLYTMKPDMTTGLRTLKRDVVPFCGPTDDVYTDVADIIACMNYLNNIGTTTCGVQNSQGAQFCFAGTAQVYGQGPDGGPASTPCSDVANAVLWIVNDCTRPDQTCAGAQAAGNIDVGAAINE